MVGDGAANAEVSGSGREGERDRADAETVSGTVGTAERSISADVPPGLWQFARKKLREAYFHAARASVRDLELHPRPPRDEDRVAADPPDPEPGVRRVLSAIRDLAVAAADVPAADDEYQTRSASNRSKRRKKKETRASTVCARFDADAKAAAATDTTAVGTMAADSTGLAVTTTMWRRWRPWQPAERGAGTRLASQAGEG